MSLQRSSNALRHTQRYASEDSGQNDWLRQTIEQSSMLTSDTFSSSSVVLTSEHCFVSTMGAPSLHQLHPKYPGDGSRRIIDDMSEPGLSFQGVEHGSK